MKLATEQAEVNRVQWGYSTPAEIRSGEVPAAFDTSARFVIICNSWPVGNPDVDAIQSRGTILYFCPSAAEMHRYASPPDGRRRPRASPAGDPRTCRRSRRRPPRAETKTRRAALKGGRSLLC